MGYVGFSVAFAFAIAALIGGRLDATWARWSRPWTTVAWCVPHDRHRARQRVGVLRARLGRLVVLGSGRERVVHAVARRHRADPFAGRHREARHVPQLDGAARDRRVLAVAARHVPRALRRADVGARVRHRSGARRVHPRVPRDRHRRLARALRVCAPARSAAAAASRPCRASRCCSPTTSCWSSRWRACCSARCIRCSSMRSTLGKISVGPPYFDAVFVPLMAPLVFLMGVGPIAAWRKARAARSVDAAALGARRRAGDAPLLLPFAFGQLVAARRVRAVPRAVGRRRDGRLRCVQRLRSAPQRGLARASCAANPPAWYGMLRRAPRHRRVHRRRDAGARATRSSATCGSTSGRASTSAATRSRSAASTPQRRARTTARWSARSTSRATASAVAHAAAGEAHLQRVRPDDDRSGDRARASPATATCRSASRSRTRAHRRVGRAHLRQALRRLDLGRLPS